MKKLAPKQASKTKECQIKIEFINIPELLDPKNQIMDNLIRAENEDLILSRCVKAVMNFKWTTYAESNVYWQMILYIFLLITFTFYTLLFIEGEVTLES